PTAADEKRICARASSEPRRFKIEKQQPFAEARLNGGLKVRSEQVQPRPGWQAVRKRHTPVTIARCIFTLDNEECAAARFAPFAAENLGRVRRVGRFTVCRLPAPTIVHGRQWGEPLRLALWRTIKVRPTGDWFNNSPQTIGERAHADTG